MTDKRIELARERLNAAYPERMSLIEGGGDIIETALDLAEAAVAVCEEAGDDDFWEARRLKATLAAFLATLPEED